MDCMEIIERCEVDYINEGEIAKDTPRYANRIVIYRTSKKNIKDAVADYIENWNITKIIRSYDEFDGCCLNSEIISSQFIKKDV